MILDSIKKQVFEKTKFLRFTNETRFLKNVFHYNTQLYVLACRVGNDFILIDNSKILESKFSREINYLDDWYLIVRHHVYSRHNYTTLQTFYINNDTVECRIILIEIDNIAAIADTDTIVKIKEGE